MHATFIKGSGDEDDREYYCEGCDIYETIGAHFTVREGTWTDDVPREGPESQIILRNALSDCDWQEFIICDDDEWLGLFADASSRLPGGYWECGECDERYYLSEYSDDDAKRYAARCCQ